MFTISARVHYWRMLSVLTMGVLVTLSASAVKAQNMVSGDHIATGNGDLIVQPINHATFAMSWDEKTIYVDPVGGAERFVGLPGPDLIFVTDIHGDHLSADTLAAIVGADTVIIAPAAVAEQLPDGLRQKTDILANDEETTVLGINIKGVAMYNLTEERLGYHEKGRGNGYVAAFGGTRVYISGDTEDIPEMRSLDDIDIAFVCFNLPYTMTEDQAASAVRDFSPDVVYPYHYGESDLEKFSMLVGEGNGIEIRMRNWY